MKLTVHIRCNIQQIYKNNDYVLHNLTTKIIELIIKGISLLEHTLPKWLYLHWNVNATVLKMLVSKFSLFLK